MRRGVVPIQRGKKSIVAALRKPDWQAVLMQHLERETMNVWGHEWIWD
jgi:hypothetical protein